MVVVGDNLLSWWFERSILYSSRYWLWGRVGGAWRGYTYGESADIVVRLAGCFSSFGMAEGSRVIILSSNRPEWVLSNLAIMAEGFITTPVYTTYGSSDFGYVAGDSGASCLVVEDVSLLRIFLASLVGVEGANIGHVVLIESPDDVEFASIRSEYSSINFRVWSELVISDAGDGAGDGVDADGVDADGVDSIEDWRLLSGVSASSDSAVVIIYSSGTTGLPLGVELSHGSLLSNVCGCMGVVDTISFINVGQERFLSFLPLSHAYEFMCGQFLSSAMGAEVFFTSVELLRSDMVDISPTLMTAVPRLYEALRSNIRHGLRGSSFVVRYLFAKTVELGERCYLLPDSVGYFEGLLNMVLGWIVRRRVRLLLGGRLKAFISGGAALNCDVALFFTSLGVLILQGYGLTEASPVVSVNIVDFDGCNPDDIYGVGYPLSGVFVEIADDGEILVSGGCVMNGYWGNSVRSGEVLRDGWLYTGDLGYFDSAGRLHITDRKKDIIVTYSGENVSPVKLENLLVGYDCIEQVVIYGDDDGRICCLVVVGSGFGEVDVEFVIGEVNGMVSVCERVRNFRIIGDGFSIENGLMTPTMKLKRRAILEKYL